MNDFLPISNGRDPYWSNVQKRICNFVGSTQPETLLLTGESASDPRFLQAVKNALASPSLPLPAIINERHGSERTTWSYTEYFCFATAMGAAEVAKRRQEGMVRCCLSDECRDIMHRERIAENSKEL